MLGEDVVLNETTVAHASDELLAIEPVAGGGFVLNFYNYEGNLEIGAHCPAKDAADLARIVRRWAASFAVGASHHA